MLNIITQYGSCQIDGVDIFNILSQNEPSFKELYQEWIIKYLDKSKLIAGIDYINIDKKYYIDMHSISSILSLILIDYEHSNFTQNFVNLKCWIKKEFNKKLITEEQNKKENETKIENTKNKLFKLIENEKKITLSLITRKSQYIEKNIRDEILNELINEGKIEKIKQSVPNSFKPTTVYKYIESE